MKLSVLTIMAAGMLAACLPSAKAEVAIGQPAPDFTATDTNGVEHTLSDFKGKNVVLEWTNHECPFVVKHYEPGNMQKIQKQATNDGTVWISIVSSAEGKQGHVTSEEANSIMKEKGSNAPATILDPSGEIGKMYGAKTTPHMFVINKEGNVAYAGAIDSDSSFKSSAIEGATNYVVDALAALNAGEEIKVASTKPYGCSVKY